MSNRADAYLTAIPPLLPWSIAIQRIGELTWPVLVAQLASISMMVIDTLLVGHHSTTDLAAVAIGSSLYVSLMLGLAGITQALGPIVAHDYGAQRHEKIGEWIRQGLWLAALLSIPGCSLLLNPQGILAQIGIAPTVATRTADYLQLLAWCLPASLLYRSFHAAANALGQPRPLMAIGIGQTLGHALLASFLVLGGAHVPAMGAEGAAMSQAIMSWLTLAAGGALVLKGTFWKPYACLAHWSWPKIQALREMLRLGLPMGISYLVEITAFTFVALFVARLGAEVLSAHRIVANLSAVIYMLPLSIATATSALVAQAAGGQRETEARQMAWAGITLASLTSAIIGVLVWFFREQISGWGSVDSQVIALATGLVFYIALYQLPDAAQTVAGFALRGYKVTFAPLLIHLSAFWGLGLGLGYWLAFMAPAPQGVAGFWQATLVSTLAACLCLGGLLTWVMRQRVAEPSIRRLSVCKRGL